jgi:hypothetical protein
MNLARVEAFLAWWKDKDEGCFLMLNNCPIMSHVNITKPIPLDAVFHAASIEHILKLS